MLYRLEIRKIKEWKSRVKKWTQRKEELNKTEWMKCKLKKNTKHKNSVFWKSCKITKLKLRICLLLLLSHHLLLKKIYSTFLFAKKGI